MKSLKKQTNNLKLNVSNINSYLINSNKQLKTLKIKNKNFARKELQKQSRIQRERKLESPLKGITGVFNNITSKAKTPFRSIFDKLFEFFTIIATGVIVDKLPQIISAVSNFFKNNKWIFDGLSFVFNAIGNGINGIINLVNFLTEPKKKEIEENLNDIDKKFDTLNKELDVDLSDLPSESIPEEGDEPTDSGIVDEPIDRRADEPNIMPDGSTVRVGDMVGGSDFASPEPTKIKPPKKYAKGGLVTHKKVSNNSSKIAEKQSLKKSNDFINYAKVVESNNFIFKLVKENRKKFGDTVDSIIEIETYLKGGRRRGSGGGRRGSGGGRRGSSAGGKVGNDLFSTISRGEGGINSYNTGTAGSQEGYTPPKPISQMTVGEIMDAQRGNLHAVGKYQIIPSTMKDFVQSMGISRDDVFNEETQDKFKEYTVNYKRPSVGKFLTGAAGSSLEKAQLALAAEFASVGVPYDMKRGEYALTSSLGPIPTQDIKRGESLYKGIGENAASISPEDIAEALRKEKEINLKPTPEPEPTPQSTPQSTRQTVPLEEIPKNLDSPEGREYLRRLDAGELTQQSQNLQVEVERPVIEPTSLSRNIREDTYPESETGTIALQRVYIIKNNTIPMPIPV